MAKLSNATVADFRNVQNTISEGVRGTGSFEEAAQKYTSIIYQNFKDSIVLMRLFATVPYGELPFQNKNFVDKLADSKRVGQMIHDQTLILSLLGTSGVKPDWNNRKNSQGHIGIPLVSAEFIDAIPMMSRLLKQLGIGLDWIDSNDTQLVKHTLGSINGVFFVPDAATEVDLKGRKVIAAQDFVAAHKVKTVFGFGGGYIGTETFYVTIIFLQETIKKNMAVQFAGAMSYFKANTANLVKKKIFA